MLTAKYHHNQNASWRNEDDVEDVVEALWGQLSCHAKIRINSFYGMRYA
jgi:hypothetical protein